jgi:AcrR family transcriptional regulator
VSPRAYQPGRRQTTTEASRLRILAAARDLLAAERFSEFTMDAVARKAKVTRLTVYYQFESRAGLLEALYNDVVRRGKIHRLAEMFRRGGDPLRMLHEFIDVFARLWESDRKVIRRLHALAAIDPEIGEGLRARNERRRNAARVVVESYCSVYPPLTRIEIPLAIDTLHMLTSFETYDALAGSALSRSEVIEIIRNQAYRAIGFTPRPI